MATAVEHDREQSRYVLLVDGAAVSVVGYERRGEVVVLQHTGTEIEHRRRGHATELVAEVLADLDREGLRPIARCPFVRSYLSRSDAVRGPASTEDGR
jgi:predicted GNAT family acetyltransferase